MDAFKKFFTGQYPLDGGGKFLLLLLCVVCLCGVGLLVTGLFPLASWKTRRIMKRFAKSTVATKKKDGVSSLDDSLYELSKRFVPLIHMDKIEESEMDKALRLSNMGYTPQQYKAYMLTVTGVFVGAGLILLAVGTIMKFLLFVILGVGIGVIGVVEYFLIRAKLANNHKNAVRDIEIELPRFVSFIRMNLLHSDESVLSMVERYTTENKKFTEEWKQTIADAKTSSFRAAIARLNQRVNSDKLTKVTTGLVNAYNGDDMNLYFAMLERDFTNFEIVYLKDSVKTVGSRMTFPKMLMYAALVAALFFPIVAQVVSSFREVFATTDIAPMF